MGELERALERVSVAAEAAGRQIVVDSAAIVERAAKSNFEGAHKRGEPHVGGSKPNIVTGTLRRSITPDPVRNTGLGVWSTKIGPRVIYGRRVELGYAGGAGRGRQKTRPFPYFQPAVRATAPQVQAVAASHWAAAIRSI